MSRVSISKSYAVLIGLESYAKARSKIKHVEGRVVGGGEKIFRPEEVRRREEAGRDKRRSVGLEREREGVEEEEREKEKEKEKEDGWVGRLRRLVL